MRGPQVGERILGIDPGLNITGYGVVECTPDGPRLCEAGIVRGKTRNSLTSRLHEIHAGVVDVLKTLQPCVMAIEELYSHYKRPRTAILMGHARGVICLAASMADV
ncbi:MAG: crossover junction endodeoxyribonuclease RuvC, partial [Pirellulales bacterium]